MFNFFKSKKKAPEAQVVTSPEAAKEEKTPTYLEKRVLYIKEQERIFSEELKAIPKAAF